MRNLLGASALVCVFLLGACSSDQWVHRYKKEGEFLSDYNKCDREVADRTNAQVIALGAYQQSVLLDQCLQKEGWRKVRR